MRRASLMIGLLVLAAGCSLSGRTASGAPTGVGVLVQASAGRCVTVLVGTQPRRVCGPRGKAPGETPAPDTLATSDTARVTR
jgi:hypothetical protein